MSEAAVETVSEGKKRGISKTREGQVVSDKMDKTVVVNVVTHKRHPTYGKYVLHSTRYLAHDERNECNLGDKVRIVETRPLSKRKRWRVQSIVERAI